MLCHPPLRAFQLIKLYVKRSRPVDLFVAYVFMSFMQSKSECQYLINLAKPHMHKSTVVDGETGKSKDSRWNRLPFLFSYSFKLFMDYLIICYDLTTPMFLNYNWFVTLILSCRVRTSSGTFLARGRDKTIREIEKRIADFTFLPVGMHCSSFSI